MISLNKRAMAAFCLMTGLVACSSDGSNERAVEALRELAVNPFQAAQEIRIPTDKPYIVVSYGEARTPMTLISDENGIAQFIGPAGVEMTLHNGILARLRGLGQEYEAFYTASDGPYRGNLLKLAQGGATVTRTGVYWIDQQPKRERFRCKFAFQRVQAGLRRFGEKCESLYQRLSFSNTYWTDRNGVLVKSIQWLHPEALSLEIEHRRVTGER